MSNAAKTAENTNVFAQLHSCVWRSVTARTAAFQASLVLHYLPEFAQIHVHQVSDALQPSHPLSLSSEDVKILGKWNSSQVLWKAKP